MENNYNKQFCFAVERSMSKDFTDQDYLGRYFESNLDLLERIKVYKSEGYFFILVDEHSKLGLGDFKNRFSVENIISNLNFTKKHTFLERVFKKRIDTSGRVFEKRDNTRTVMTLEIRNNLALLEEYKEIHRNVWPQIISNMDRMGIYDMEIYLHGYQVFMVLDTIPDFDMIRDGEQWASLPMEEEWQEHVSRFQKVDSKSKALEKWKLMTEIGQ